MSDDLQHRARSFGGVADAYDRGRPSYPRDAVSWLLTGTVPDDADDAGDASGTAGGDQLTVLELGAGTGKLTRLLVEAGHDVHASEPDEKMLAVLRRDLPGVRTSRTGAEDIPLGDASVDVVVAAQCFHWFDSQAALDEISRVLKPGGQLALVWNERDERIPWVKKLGLIIGNQDHLVEPAADVSASPLFGEVDDATFTYWQQVNRRSIVDLVASRSNVATMGEAEREHTIEKLLALYDDYGRGMDGMQLPYRTRCFRSAARPRPRPKPAPAPERSPAESDDGDGDGTEPGSLLTRTRVGASFDPALDLPDPAIDPLLEPTVPISVADYVAAGIARSQLQRRGSAPGGRDPMTDSADRMPRVAWDDPDDDTGMMLIDFR